MDAFERQLFDSLFQMLGGLLFVVLLEVAAAVFLGVCVYNDAKFRGDKNAALWGVLSGFFALAALVYLIVQLTSNNKPAYCIRCRNAVPRGYPACPVCGLPVYNGGAPLTPAALEGYNKRRKLFLVLYIAFTVAYLVFFFLFILGFFREFMDLLQMQQFA